jgi:hypothetical protein
LRERAGLPFLPGQRDGFGALRARHRGGKNLLGRRRGSGCLLRRNRFGRPVQGKLTQIFFQTLLEGVRALLRLCRIVPSPLGHGVLGLVAVGAGRQALDDYLRDTGMAGDGPLFVSRTGRRLVRQHVDRLLKQLAAQANTRVPSDEPMRLIFYRDVRCRIGNRVWESKAGLTRSNQRLKLTGAVILDLRVSTFLQAVPAA